MFPEHAVKAYAEVDGQVFQVSKLRPSRAVGLKEVGTGVHLPVTARKSTVACCAVTACKLLEGGISKGCGLALPFSVC